MPEVTPTQAIGIQMLELHKQYEQDRAAMQKEHMAARKALADDFRAELLALYIDYKAAGGVITDLHPIAQEFIADDA